MMTFLVTAFYLVGILAILWEANCIQDPEKNQNFVEKLKSDVKEKIPFDMFTKSQKSFAMWQLGYSLWVLVGIFFTFQWYVFLAFLLFSFIPKKSVSMRRFDGIVSLLFLLFVIINHFHLHLTF